MIIAALMPREYFTDGVNTVMEDLLEALITENEGVEEGNAGELYYDFRYYFSGRF
jgi:hypothetical protein